jgi:hypothetical protein
MASILCSPTSLPGTPLAITILGAQILQHTMAIAVDLPG